MTESHLARSLFSEPKKQLARKKNVHSVASDSSAGNQNSLPTPLAIAPTVELIPEISSDQSLEIEILRLKQELATLHQHVVQHEIAARDKNTYIELLETESNQLQSVQSELLQQQSQVSLLKSQLAQSEGTAKALQNSLEEQLQQNWEHQHQQLLASFHETQRQAQESLAAQALEIEQLRQSNTQLELYQQELLISLKQAKLSLEASQKTEQVLQARLSEINGHSDELESQVIKQLSSQVIIHQSIQELESNYIAAQSRLAELEPQIAELQEQILKQAGQASEYEAAVQHWKYQAITHQRHAIQLSGALDRFLEAKDAGKKNNSVMGENEPQAMITNEQSDRNTPPASSPKVSTTVNLPSFLLRQR